MIKNKKRIKNSIAHIFLAILAFIWLVPIIWIVLTSFSTQTGIYSPNIIPKEFTLNNYIKLFTDTNQFYFAKWFANTLIVAIFSCLLSTFYVLSIAFVTSRLRFKMRKPLMNFSLVIGMFPGFMSMIAVYYIIKGLGLSQSLIALVLAYSGSAGLGFFVAKGYFDTIPKSIDESAWLDGATKFQVFTRITIPLSKSILIYTILISFIAPWGDYIFVSVLMGDNYDKYTVALGLYKMLELEFIDTWYTRFAAGAVLVSIPIAILYILLQRYYRNSLAGAVKG
ncbi:MAG TPA: sugar ABC transporter permease [Clostridiales bacterium]|nr:sugar ABC transporter permease [Clostridiales bacterium]